MPNRRVVEELQQCDGERLPGSVGAAVTCARREQSRKCISVQH